MPLTLVDRIKDYKVSSVLSNDRRVYGKKFLFDGKEETCWNSDQGTPQWIHFGFDTVVTLTEIRLQFQGGFVGKECELGILPENAGAEASQIEAATPPFNFSAEDTNALQHFQIPVAHSIKGRQFYLNFSNSTDFYGRIIVYHFDILGEI